MEVGTVKRGDELGKTGYTKQHWFMWHACIDCGKTRWVNLKNKSRLIPYHIRCRGCATKTEEYRINCSKGQRGKRREKSGAWKGGVTKIDGYRCIYLSPSDPYFPMVVSSKKEYGGYVKEHRLVMAKYLGRCLNSWEIVHHKDGDKDNNYIDNLELIPNPAQHNTQLNLKIKQLTQENNQLRERLAYYENTQRPS